VLRYRRSRDEEREQIKWIAFAASVVGLLFLIGIVISFIYGWEPPSWSELLDLVTGLSYAGVPIAVGFAVLKYRLYDIDVIINRTLVYGSLTASLALMYFGGVAMSATSRASAMPRARHQAAVFWLRSSPAPSTRSRAPRKRPKVGRSPRPKAFIRGRGTASAAKPTPKLTQPNPRAKAAAEAATPCWRCRSSSSGGWAPWGVAALARASRSR
jgi:hypothetical protein